METRLLVELATRISQYRLATDPGASGCSVLPGFDIILTQECTWIRCQLKHLDNMAIFYSLATLIASRLSIISWNHSIETFAPTFNPPVEFPEQWADDGVQYLWVRIKIKPRETVLIEFKPEKE